MRLVYFVRRFVIAAITIILTLSIYWSYKSTFHTSRTIRHTPTSNYQKSLPKDSGEKPTEQHIEIHRNGKTIMEHEPTSKEFTKITELFETSTKPRAPTRESRLMKLSHCPGISKILLRPEGLCYMMIATRHIPVVQGEPLSLPCYVLPAHLKKLTYMLTEQAKDNMTFLVQDLKSSPSSQRILDVVSNIKQLKRYLEKEAVVQTLTWDVINGGPVVMQIYVLLASLSPLRVYRYKEATTKLLTQLDQGVKQAWSMDMSYSKEDIDEIWDRVNQLIVNTLLLTESSVQSIASTVPAGEQNCVQLLRFQVVVNSTLQPFVAEVKVAEDVSTPLSIVNDAVQLVFGRAPVTSHVNSILEGLKYNIGIEGRGCVTSHQICLRQQELQYLMECEREAANLGGFTRLYPTHEGRRYDPLIFELQSLHQDGGHHIHRGTPFLHKALTVLERYRQFGAEPPSIGQHNADRKDYWATADEDDSEREHNEELQKISTKDADCDNDRDVTPVLTAIYTDPPTQLHPTFRHDVETYRITLPFHVMVVRLWGRTSTCSSEARVNSYTGTAKPANYSLGIGWNKYAIHLVDMSRGKSWVLTSYKLHIYRRMRDESKTPFSSNVPHAACSLVQDCDMRIYPGKSCGIQDMKRNWGEFSKSQTELPPCRSGHDAGRWVLPCGRCDNPESCHARKAVWAPYTCRHYILSKQQVKTCLANKKVLFVGDSTNRGIMYYLMEKINGSLQHWEKTHTMKVYSGALNEDRTSVSFAYYPQFWLSSDKKPVFIKALLHLIARFMPLENNTNTILVVGGVHWMLPSHVTEIRHALTRLGLNGIKVVIKGLGSGFHLLAFAGRPKLDMEGQLRVTHRNSMVTRAARSAGFELVDTYNITVARYKEFLYGKCGCHFHKVVNVKSDGDFRDADQGPQDVKDDTAGPLYHVTGSINALYSDIMISRMCS